MYLLSLALAVIVPALLLLAYGVIKTRRGLLGEALWAGFVGGIAVGVCVMAWELVLQWLLPLENLPPVADAAGHALLIAALPEEGLKYGATLIVVRRFVSLGDVPDVIRASLAVAIGFAVTENAGYLISASGTGALMMGIVAVVRALSAVPLHAICGLTMGALIGGAAWNESSRDGQARLTAALVLPILIHGAYDFLLILHQRAPALEWPLQWLPVVFTGAALTAIILCNLAMRGARTPMQGWASGRASAAGSLGGALLIIGLLLVLLVLATPGMQAKQALVVYCVVPLLLGVDLTWTALSQSHGPARRRGRA